MPDAPQIPGFAMVWCDDFEGKHLIQKAIKSHILGMSRINACVFDYARGLLRINSGKLLAYIDPLPYCLMLVNSG